MQKEYDFSKGVRGKYAKRYASGGNLIRRQSPARRAPRGSAKMTIYISEQRPTGPAVFLAQPFRLVSLEMLRIKEFAR